MSSLQLRALFPACVELCATQLENDARPELEAPLYPEEAEHIARAVPKRLREFTLGRTCARQAMAALGLPPAPLPANEDRSVRWPDAVWGSITHTEGLCAAVAARRDALRGVGIDAEVRGRVTEKLWEHIANPAEIRWFRAGGDALTQAERATLLFSAKEAFYKAQYCVTRTYVGFHEVTLDFDPSGEFRVTLQNDIASAFARGATFAGRYVQLSGHVVTGLVIAH
ncbi:MAG TPA: 4'-phosphopantetheinyl transferase superfamily protein [Polyangiales bacterium]